MAYVLLTGDEIAETLKVSRSKAFSLMRNGKIRSIRFGRNVRVRPEDLEQFINSHSKEVEQFDLLEPHAVTPKKIKCDGDQRNEVRHA